MSNQTTWVTDWTQKPAVEVQVTLPRREGAFRGYPHLSECLLFSSPDLYCTCDDDSPDWTI